MRIRILNALITGVTGFTGSELARLLIRKKAKVTGTIWREKNLGNIADMAGSLKVCKCDIRKEKAVERLISSVKCDVIFHTASMTFIPDCFKNPQKTVSTNIAGMVNLLEAVRRYNPKARLVIISSGGVYDTKYTVPIKEHFSVNPSDPYSVSKRSQELFALQYHKNYNIDCVIARTFNLIGSKQRSSFVTSNFARQIKKIKERGKSGVIKVGNLSAVRDFLDIKDAVRAYYLLYKRGASGEIYNVCSNEGIKISYLLDMMLKMSGINANVLLSPDKRRVIDRPYQVGCNDKLKELGFTRKNPLNKSIEMLLH